MSLEKGVLARIDNKLRSELSDRGNTQMAKVPVSDTQWAVWKRYCDMVGVSIGAGIATLIDQELASVVEEEIESLSDSVRAREAAVSERESQVSYREEALASRERFLARRDAQVEEAGLRLEDRNRELDVKAGVLNLIGTEPQTRPTPMPSPKLGRNDPCWCGSGKKYKVCHLER